MTKKHIDKIVKKGKDAEQDFLNWLDENKFSYLYINQDSESFPKLFTNQVKSAYIGVFGQQCRSSTGHFCNEIF